MKLPVHVQSIMGALESAGFESYVVGGAVRDFLLRRKTSDYDLCTSARPEETMHVLGQFSPDGSAARYGVVSVGDGTKRVEITTFRREGGYVDGRHPESVEFTKNLAEDLARRDFTVNAVAYNPKTGYIDPFCGRDDIKRRIIKTIGDPYSSFSQDALRIMRAVRFASQLGFAIESNTRAAAENLADALEKISHERVRDELFRFVTGPRAGNALLQYRKIIFSVIPELERCDGFEQHNPNHNFDVFGHTAETLRRSSRALPLRLAALLHDIGKPLCFSTDANGRGRFWGHMEKGAEISREILERLQCPQKLADTVCLLVESHDKPYSATPASARFWLNRVGRRNIFLLIELKKADCLAHAKSYHNRLARIYGFKREVLASLRRGDCFTLGALALSGGELCDALEMRPGPKVGALLGRLLEGVLDGSVNNDKDELIALAKIYKDERTSLENGSNRDGERE
ncbi:MAG: CCA tRNA nucleotidyltransferase [Oscillospiraceae bacterium]